MGQINITKCTQELEREIEPLTQQEIDSAPEWSTHYLFIASDLCYEGNGKYMFVSDGEVHVDNGDFVKKRGTIPARKSASN